MRSAHGMLDELSPAEMAATTGADIRTCAVAITWTRIRRSPGFTRRTIPLIRVDRQLPRPQEDGSSDSKAVMQYAGATSRLVENLVRRRGTAGVVRNRERDHELGRCRGTYGTSGNQSWLPWAELEVRG